MILVIDDDAVMAACIARACKKEVKIFANAIEAMQEIAQGDLPDLIFLDILLDGPDGFTFLNELVSYEDTKKIPVVIVSSFNYSQRDLACYGVVGCLNKDTMIPQEIYDYVREYAN